MIVVQVTGPGRKTGFIRCSSSQAKSEGIIMHRVCMQAKDVVSPQALVQEIIETKVIMCSQKIGSENGF